jgi:hypothetical protein
MKSDIRRYISLRDSLMQEKTKLENRLQEINDALGQGSSPIANTLSGAPAPSLKVGTRRGRGRASGGLSLRDAVLQVTARGPLSKEEILNGVKQLGYRFSTSNPLNSLGVILYGKSPKFKNDVGRFSPIGGSSSSVSKTEGAAKGGRKRRKLSPEARERIAAAQRARWAKAKGGK